MNQVILEVVAVVEAVDEMAAGPLVLRVRDPVPIGS